MSAPQRSMRTALGKVRHTGAGHSGTGHFVATRVSSVALAILAPWFAITAALSIEDASLVGAIDYLSNPVNAVGVILLVVVGFYHMSIGMQEVILDYIERPITKIVLLILNAFVPLVLAAGAIFAVLLVNFGV